MNGGRGDSKVTITYISPKFLLWWWLSEPALEEDLSAAHVCRCLLFLALLPLVCHWYMTAPGSWSVQRAVSVRPATAAVCYLHRRTLLTLLCAMIIAKNAQLGRKKINKSKRRPKCGAHKIRSNRGKRLSWCGARKYRRVSAVCFPTHTTPTE